MLVPPWHLRTISVNYHWHALRNRYGGGRRVTLARVATRRLWHSARARPVPILYQYPHSPSHKFSRCHRAPWIFLKVHPPSSYFDPSPSSARSIAELGSGMLPRATLARPTLRFLFANFSDNSKFLFGARFYHTGTRMHFMWVAYSRAWRSYVDLDLNSG